MFHGFARRRFCFYYPGKFSKKTDSKAIMDNFVLLFRLYTEFPDPAFDIIKAIQTAPHILAVHEKL